MRVTAVTRKGGNEEVANFVHVGYGNLVNGIRIVAVEPKRGNQQESNLGSILNMAHGRKANSVIVMDTGYRILSAVSPDELQERMVP